MTVPYTVAASEAEALFAFAAIQREIARDMEPADAMAFYRRLGDSILNRLEADNRMPDARPPVGEPCRFCGTGRIHTEMDVRMCAGCGRLAGEPISKSLAAQIVQIALAEEVLVEVSVMDDDGYPKFVFKDLKQAADEVVVETVEDWLAYSRVLANRSP